MVMHRVAASVVFLLGLPLASADPNPGSPRTDTNAPKPPGFATLIEAAMAIGDFNQHPTDPLAISATFSPLLSADIRGVHLVDGGRAELAATGVALFGASLIAMEHQGSWCSGPGCAVGAAALLFVAPLLQAAAHDERGQ
jgi:hypothetical protein